MLNRDPCSDHHQDWRYDAAVVSSSSVLLGQVSLKQLKYRVDVPAEELSLVVLSHIALLNASFAPETVIV